MTLACGVHATLQQHLMHFIQYNMYVVKLSEINRDTIENTEALLKTYNSITFWHRTSFGAKHIRYMLYSNLSSPGLVSVWSNTSSALVKLRQSHRRQKKLNIAILNSINYHMMVVDTHMLNKRQEQEDVCNVICTVPTRAVQRRGRSIFICRAHTCRQPLFKYIAEIKDAI